MKRYEKVLLIIGTVGVIVFILYGLPRISAMLEPKLGFNPYVILCLACVFCLWVVGRAQGGSEMAKMNKQLRELDRELLHTHRIDYYIIQNKRMYKETENVKYRAIFMTNIATAYYHDGKYDKSNAVIEKLNFDQLSEGQIAAMYNQKFLNLFYLKQYDKAKEVYDAHAELFHQYEENKEFRSHYLFSKLSYDLAVAGKDADAIGKVREIFDTIKISSKAYQKAYNYRFLEGKLMIAEGNTKEGKDNLRLLQKEYLMPGLKREIAKALKY